MNKKLLGLLICLIPLTFTGWGCCGGKQEGKPSIVDSLEERQAQALKVITRYPMQEWQDDVSARISTFVGKDVTQQVIDKTRMRLSAKEILEKRISLLTEVFSAQELSIYAELCNSDHGKAFVKKTTLQDEKLRDLVAPIIGEVLSNSTP